MSIVQVGRILSYAPDLPCTISCRCHSRVTNPTLSLSHPAGHGGQSVANVEGDEICYLLPVNALMKTKKCANSHAARYGGVVAATAKKNQAERMCNVVDPSMLRSGCFPESSKTLLNHVKSI